MAKKLKMDYSEDRLLSVAEHMLDDHDYLGALKMINRNVALGSYSADNYMMYADAFDDMGLYEKCVNNWFRYYDCNGDYNVDEVNEGLAMAYMNLGQNDVSAFYYNRLLRDSGEVNEQDRSQLLKTFLGGEKNPLRIVYPPEKADYSKEIADGIAKMRENEFAEAAEIFEDIPEVNPDYINARNYLAMCYIISERYADAEEQCLAILQKDDKNIQALISYAAVKSECGQREESIKIAKRLLEINPEDADDIYKIATVCCENDMHLEAYEAFCSLGYEMQYDFNMLYFKAMAAFNCGKNDKAVQILKDLLTVYPDAVTARRNLEIMKQKIESGDDAPMAYFYRLPLGEREYNIKTLIEFDALNKAQTQAYDRWDELHEIVLWCIEEAESRNDKDMTRAAVLSAIKAGFDDIVRKILLNAFLPDDLKIGVLQKLCERNEDNNFGVVCCNIYRNLDLYKVKIGRAKHKLFIEAYSALVCRFALIDADYSQSIAESCERLYEKLAAQNKLSVCTEEAALSAAMFSTSDMIATKIFSGDVCAFFGADPKVYRAIMEDLI